MYGDAFPHETNMDRLHGVDFDKGCYVGQEVVSRMQHRGTARTRTVRVILEDFSPEAGTAVLAGDKPVGTMGSTAGGQRPRADPDRSRRRRARCRRDADRGRPCDPPRRSGRRAHPRRSRPSHEPMSARLHADGKTRCPWPGEDPFYMAYHDTEWGVPEYDDRALYEKLILDGFQAGLSWITILRKRDNFRKAFDDFQPEKIARYNAKKVHALMNDAGIVRNRAKIEGAVNSAKAYLKIMEEGPGFSKFLWDFVDGKPKVNQFKTTASVPASTPVSIKISKELARADSSSSARPSSTPSCRPPAWSTTIWSPASATRPAAASSASPASRPNDGESVRPYPRRAWQRMLSGRRLDLLDPSPLDIEIADIAHGLARVARWNGQTSGAHIFSVAQHTLLVEAVMREQMPRVDVTLPARRAAARRAGICHRRHDLAVQGGARRRLQGGGEAAAGRDPYPLRPAAGAGRRDHAAIKAADRGAAYLEATRLAGFAEAEAKRLFGRDPGLPEATERDYLTPWTAAKAEKQFLARFTALHP